MNRKVRSGILMLLGRYPKVTKNSQRKEAGKQGKATARIIGRRHVLFQRVRKVQGRLAPGRGLLWSILQVPSMWAIHGGTGTGARNGHDRHRPRQETGGLKPPRPANGPAPYGSPWALGAFRPRSRARDFSISAYRCTASSWPCVGIDPGLSSRTRATALSGE